MPAWASEALIEFQSRAVMDGTKTWGRRRQGDKATALRRRAVAHARTFHRGNRSEPRAEQALRRRKCTGLSSAALLAGRLSARPAIAKSCAHCRKGAGIDAASGSREVYAHCNLAMPERND